MSVFDTLAEQRYQDWLEKVSAPDYTPPPPDQQTARRTSYEGYIFQEVLRCLDSAATAETLVEKHDMLARSHKLEAQLIILLEKRKMPYAAARLSASIASHRTRVTGRQQDCVSPLDIDRVRKQA